MTPKTVAQYLTVGGATINVTEESAYSAVTVPTETVATCAGCGERNAEDWGWDFWANERGDEQPDSYHGGHATRTAKAWAQAHAEKCRAMPLPSAGD